MKAKQITYGRLISKCNYENEKIEICLEAEEVIARSEVNDEELPF